MQLFSESVTYHNCPVEQREKVMLSCSESESLLRKMHVEPNISEAAVLSTCNRTEVYCYARKNFDVRSFVIERFCELKPAGVEVWKKHAQQRQGEQVVRHLFEIAAGLDSQIVGENQVLSQVKAAYSESLKQRMSKIILHRLFHQAFRVGKKVRTDTDINCGAVSIALAAVELAVDELEPEVADTMVIGAGENAELLSRYLLKVPVKSLLVANRSIAKAGEMASRLKAGRVIRLQESIKELKKVDLLISSTSSPKPIISSDAVRRYLEKRQKPLLIIDLAVPRDVEKAVADFPCVTLYDIDDLNQCVSGNEQKRLTEVPKAERIVCDFVKEFMRWYDSLSVVPVISALQERGMELARSEAKRYAGEFSPDDSQRLRKFAESLVKKVLHGPVSFIKNNGEQEPSAEQLQAAELVNKMFLSNGGQW